MVFVRGAGLRSSSRDSCFIVPHARLSPYPRPSRVCVCPRSSSIWRNPRTAWIVNTPLAGIAAFSDALPSALTFGSRAEYSEPVVYTRPYVPAGSPSTVNVASPSDLTTMAYPPSWLMKATASRAVSSEAASIRTAPGRMYLKYCRRNSLVHLWRRGRQACTVARTRRCTASGRCAGPDRAG